MTDPDRVERLWLVLAVATRYVLVVGGEADEAEFATATVPEPSARPVPSATARPPARGASGRAWVQHCGVTSRPAPTSKPRRRQTGTKQRLVSILRQGLAVQDSPQSDLE